MFLKCHSIVYVYLLLLILNLRVHFCARISNDDTSSTLRFGASDAFSPFDVKGGKRTTKSVPSAVTLKKNEFKKSTLTPSYITRNYGDATSTGDGASVPVYAAVYEEIPDDGLQSEAMTETYFITNAVTDSTEEPSYYVTPAETHREICDFCINGEGNFTSYGYPLNYRPGLNCSYRVRRTDNDVCELQMIFHDFDVPVSTNKFGVKGIASYECMDDYLEVYGRRYCGTQWKGRTELLPFPETNNEVLFHFRSSAQHTGRGFWIELLPKQGSCFGKKPIQVCEERFSENEFYINSPRFPYDYPNNAECKYYIRRNSKNVCGLEFTFLHFDVEAVNDCFYDRLEIDGQKYCGKLPPNTVRTISFKDDQKTISFTSDKQMPSTGFQIRVKQLTQCREPKRLPPPPSCNVCTSEKTGILVSYNYPSNYRNNLHCTYHIDRKDSTFCKIELNFDFFDIAASIDCRDDYLLLNGKRFCGTTLQSKKQVIDFDSNDSIDLVFKTDDSKSSKGFSLKYSQIRCDGAAHSKKPTKPKLEDAAESLQHEVCDQVYSQKSFIIRSESVSNLYPNNYDCNYIIRKNSSSVCYLEFTFLKFDVEASPQCSFDYLQVNKVRLCGTLKKETMRTYVFDENEKTVKFHSDSSTNRAGFVIDVNQLECPLDTVTLSSITSYTTLPSMQLFYPSIATSYTCDQVFDSQEFTITGPDYPSIYSPNIDCNFKIQKLNDDICRLDVTYYDFRIQPSDTNGYCRYDYLDFNGIRICGEVMEGSVRSFYFPENTFNVTFHSDDTETTNDRNFRIGVRQTECGNTVTRRIKPIEIDQPHCDKLFTTGTFELKSPNYPNTYPNNINCEYKIVKKPSGPPVCKLEVHFTDVYIEEDSDCRNDYIDFEGTRICGSEPKNSVKFFPFDKSVFTIKFRSDEKDRGFYKKAFFMHIRQHECPDGFSMTSMTLPLSTPPTQLLVSKDEYVCEVIIKDALFEIKSPRYPFSYNAGTKCNFIVKKNNENVCRLDLMFVAFQVGDESCQRDYVSIEEGEQLCGVVPRNTFKMYRFDSNEKLIFFKGEIGGGQGFHIRGRQVECMTVNAISPMHQTHMMMIERRSREPNTIGVPYCNQTFTKSQITVSSPNHPFNYPNGVKCFFTIKRPNSTVCALDMKFTSFDVEDDPNCAKDYLEVDNGKICGHLPPNHERRYYYFPEEQKKLLIFRSDSLASKSGFSIDIKQITDCSVRSWKPASLPPPVCDLCSHEIRGYFTSGNYPKNYDDYVRCTYRISAHSDQYCTVRLHIRDLDIEESIGCEKDYLFIQNERICNSNYRPTEITVHFPQIATKEIQFSFHADSQKNGRGFYIEYLQELCSTTTIKPGNGHQYPSTYTRSDDLITGELVSSTQLQAKKGLTHSWLQYPANYVAKGKAFIDQIVEAKVKVLDSRSDPPTVDTYPSSVEIKPVSIDVKLPDTGNSPIIQSKSIQYSTQII